MIDFRYYIVSIISVFLALAIGIVLGATTLQNYVLQDLKHRTGHLASANEKQLAKIDRLKRRNHADEKFAAAVAPSVIAGALSGQSVAVLSAPGVDGTQRSELRSLVKSAGGTVASDVRLTSSYVDPGKAAGLQAVAASVAKHTGVHLPAGADATTKAAVALADVLATPDKAAVDNDALRSALAVFADGGVITVAGKHSQPATLAVVLTGPPPQSHPKQTRAALIALARGLDDHGAGTVLAGPRAARDQKGVVAYARGQHAVTAHVSTVDNVDSAQGQAVTVLALAEQLRGKVGQYGQASSAQAALPTPLPSPQPTSTPASPEGSPTGS